MRGWGFGVVWPGETVETVGPEQEAASTQLKLGVNGSRARHRGGKTTSTDQHGPTWTDTDRHGWPALFEFLDEDFGVAAAEVVFLAAGGGQVVGGAFEEAAFGLEVGEGLR